MDNRTKKNELQIKVRLLKKIILRGMNTLAIEATLKNDSVPLLNRVFLKMKEFASDKKTLSFMSWHCFQRVWCSETLTESHKRIYQMYLFPLTKKEMTVYEQRSEKKVTTLNSDQSGHMDTSLTIRFSLAQERGFTFFNHMASMCASLSYTNFLVRWIMCI